MRPIEFRGKNISTGEWVYGAYIFFKTRNEHIITHFNADSEAKDGYLFIKGFYPVAETIDIETLGQFTGLYDDDGDKIYEGDILLDRGANIKYQVKYAKTSFRAESVNGDKRKHAGSGIWTFLKIIGNVYEHKEGVQ